ncbi:MAG: hypothetical protein KBG84_15050 [Planctomycetes bacterium]|nr:hypothetical protein [Planctomycetota bacterium]
MRVKVLRELEKPMRNTFRARKIPAPPPPGAVVATAVEAAAMFRISRAKFLKMVKDGLAPKGEKLGRNRRWMVHKLENWAANGFKMDAAT